MKCRVLIKETFHRKALIPITHIAWLILYMILFYTQSIQRWGNIFFVFSGILLPLVLTAGIFGDDYSSGRIYVLLTRPISASELYFYRLFGVIIQGGIHVALVVLIMIAINRLTENNGYEHIWTWILPTLLLFFTVASFSTSFSVITKQGYNFLFIVIMTVIILILKILVLKNRGQTGEGLQLFIKYCLPPVEILVNLPKSGYGLAGTAGCVFHALGLTGAYCLAGIILLKVHRLGRD